jgi:hypothetical protein
MSRNEILVLSQRMQKASECRMRDLSRGNVKWSRRQESDRTGTEKVMRRMINYRT